MPHIKSLLRDALNFWLTGYLPSDDTVAVKNPVEVANGSVRRHALLDRLWDCSDVLPADYCRDLGLPQDSTYAMAVRWLKANLE